MKKLIFIQKDKNLYDRKKIYNENKIQKKKIGDIQEWQCKKVKKTFFNQKKSSHFTEIHTLNHCSMKKGQESIHWSTT